MELLKDGPVSPFFEPLPFQGNAHLSNLAPEDASPSMAAAWQHAPAGACAAWGIPFVIGDPVVIHNLPVEVEIQPTQARWLVFMHTSDIRPLQLNASGFAQPARGPAQLGELAARYVIRYADGSEARAELCRRFQIGAFQRSWGEKCFEAVSQHKPFPVPGAEVLLQADWGRTQTRVNSGEGSPWENWLWAWENPQPEKLVVGFRFEPLSGLTVISAISAGSTAAHPLRWVARQKACLVLAEGEEFQPDLDPDGLLKQVQIDLGQVISAAQRLDYPNASWAETCNNQLPGLSSREILIEYTAHPQACFHLAGPAGTRVLPVSGDAGIQLQVVPPARQAVTLRVVERGSRKPVPVKLHIHGEWGEYLAPVDRHRILNITWFEDYSVDFGHIENFGETARAHATTYINGETLVNLPAGRVYIEVSKGFEIRPVRKVVEVTAETQEIEIEIERVLPWRAKGWVTADTHVHFLSPITALLEGSAEGVNVINLLASQWGELMTNVGDFDGRSTWGSRQAGGDGEYLVRVGTENRQHVLGHISLLGYNGRIIAPLTTGGPDESALGDPVEVLLTEWARQCHQQGGLVVLPHFPSPRAEHAASIVAGEIDALEMTSWEMLYAGIDPYSLADWYRYLNCGYLVPAVGGTDKMAACTAVGTVRTYARTGPDSEFTYDAWKEAVKRGETFVTYGPLLEFEVEGHPMGSRMALPAGGGQVDVTWRVASVTVPATRVELVINGEICEAVPVTGADTSGHWSVRLDHSAWLALLVRGHQAGRPEIIAAHSTPVMVQVEGLPLLAAADAVTILEQIEGAMAYLDTVGTRAEDRVYKRMHLELEAAHRKLHNRMHQNGHYHEHTPVNQH